ncbi:MAG: periplasmic heavy metal sensor [Deltaproteobacteria bacterium]|nr:periplasmic heavy metal sensor [Deltaproteobacteria bacterium]MBZ0218858.1 periplasmic heavy metal sensor [Deltaproteobacteria bacterium]
MGSKLLKPVLFISILFNITILGAAGFFYLKECGTSLGKAEKRHEAVTEKLKLTPEQKSLFKEEDKKFRASIQAAHGELAEKRRHIFRLLKEEEPDRASINASLAEIGRVQGVIEAKAIEHMLREKAVLNREQQERYLELLEKRMEKRMAERKWKHTHPSP